MNKTHNILDPDFKYTPASKTDISKTFAKIRKELKEKSTQNQRVLTPGQFVLPVEWFEG